MHLSDVAVWRRLVLPIQAVIVSEIGPTIIHAYVTGRTFGERNAGTDDQPGIAFVRSQLGEQEQVPSQLDRDSGLLPLSLLRKGERVLTAGVLELKRELEDRESGH